MSRCKELHCEECGAEFENGERMFHWTHGNATEALVCENCFDELLHELIDEMSLEDLAEKFDIEVDEADYGFAIF